MSPKEGKWGDLKRGISEGKDNLAGYFPSDNGQNENGIDIGVFLF